MYELIWFVAGAITYKFLSKLFALGQAAVVFKHIEINILVILASLTEDISFIKALRYKTMKDSGVDPEQIEKNRVLDDEFFDAWKVSCIYNMRTSTPRYIKPSFSTWNEGMNLMNKFYKDQKSDRL
jgi:hypothetical protein